MGGPSRTVQRPPAGPTFQARLPASVAGYVPGGWFGSTLIMTQGMTLIRLDVRATARAPFGAAMTPRLWWLPLVLRKPPVAARLASPPDCRVHPIGVLMLRATCENVKAP